MPARSPDARRPLLEPQCTHLHMTRLYDAEALCGVCHRPGPFGWVYQCTQDQEDLLEDAVLRGDLEPFDDLGTNLSASLTLQERSPAARQDRFSFLNEITQTQLSKYRPEHISAILRQRENVRFAISQDKLRGGSSSLFGRLAQSNKENVALGRYHFDKPWVASPQDACRYTVCTGCRPTAADRAFLSLNAVAKGEVLPSAAVGFGFHARGERPVVNAEVLKEIGCRPVPLFRSQVASADESFLSDSDISDAESIDLSRSIPLSERGTRDASMTPDTPSSCSSGDAWGYRVPGSLKYSPGCDNLAAYIKEHMAAQNQGISPSSSSTTDSHYTLAYAQESWQKSVAEKDNALCELSQKPRSTDPIPGRESAGHKEGGPSDEMETPDTGTEEAETTTRGVAILEESVELGVPDVIAQI